MAWLPDREKMSRERPKGEYLLPEFEHGQKNPDPMKNPCLLGMGSEEGREAITEHLDGIMRTRA